MMKKIIILFLVIFLCACEQPVSLLQLKSASLLSEPKKLPDFNFTLKESSHFTQEDLQGKWSLFFFGYTRCPDVCPTELYMLSEMMNKIDKQPELVEFVPQVIFVSLDAQRDMPDPLQEYVNFYHSSFIGMTGSQDAVDMLAKFMGVIYQRVYSLNGQKILINADDDIPEKLKNAYLIDHSATIILVNPKGKMHAVFGMPHRPDIIIADLADIEQAWNESL